MFKAKLKGDVLKELIKVVSTLVDEVKWNVTADGIALKAVDPAHVAMVDLSLRKEAFDDLEASDCELGIDIDKMKEVLSLAKAGDLIDMVHDEEHNKLVVRIENITRHMSLVDTMGMSDPKMPQLNLPATVKLAAAELNQGIKASESISNHIALLANNEGFELSSQGDTDSVSLKLRKDLLLSLDCAEPVRSLFSLDYFSNMVRSVPSAGVVTLSIGQDYPAKMAFDIAEGNGEVTYLLAPRIEND
ncbi:proliferating cell nuclear antigen (pcna) [Candidatus Bathyarchaeota archaeon]|nr:proliferating cell nuclear antigen (pcna) [Candidatus Bathyarchaeota archaeon]